VRRRTSLRLRASANSRSDRGYAIAQKAYGECLKDGTGLAPDDAAGARYLILAAGQGVA
jgi:TPR repeat protein